MPWKWRANPGRLGNSFGLLAAFGLIHGAHEWMEMFQILGILPLAVRTWQVGRVAVLAIPSSLLAAVGLIGLGRSPSARQLGRGSLAAALERVR